VYQQYFGRAATGRERADRLICRTDYLVVRMSSPVCKNIPFLA
jgi:hypothetical protein